MHQKYIMMWNNCTNQLSPIINHLPNTNTFSALSSFNQEKGAKSMQTLSSANCLLMNILKKKRWLNLNIVPIFIPLCHLHVFLLCIKFSTPTLFVSLFFRLYQREKEKQNSCRFGKFFTSTNICLHGCSPSLSLNFLMATISFVSCSRLKKEDASEGYVHKVNIFLYLLKW